MTTGSEFYGSEDLRPDGEPSGDSMSGGSRSTLMRPSFLVLLRCGMRSMRRFPGLLLSVYLVQLAVSVGAALVMMMILSGAFADRPLFDRAMDGDVSALIICFQSVPGLLGTLVWVGVGAILLYGVVSWFLTAGLVAVFLDAPSRPREVLRWFGSAGASNFFPFVRLALWSAVPYAIVFGVAGFGVFEVRHRLGQALDMRDLMTALALGLSPALILHWLFGTAIDYARIDLVRHPGVSSLRALARGVRVVGGQRLALVHTLLYGIVFAGLIALQGWVATETAVDALLALFALRQAFGLARFLAHAALIAGQVELACAALGTPAGRRS
jgi:hypothetical protein